MDLHKRLPQITEKILEQPEKKQLKAEEKGKDGD